MDFDNDGFDLEELQKDIKSLKQLFAKAGKKVCKTRKTYWQKIKITR
jgi:hypothetical protein